METVSLIYVHWMYLCYSSIQLYRLEAPLHVHLDSDFQSLDGLSLEPSSWLEIPLHADRPIPFKCAVSTHVVRCGRIVFMDTLGNIGRPCLVHAVGFDSLLRRVHYTAAVVCSLPRNRRGCHYNGVPYPPGPRLLVLALLAQSYELQLWLR